MKNVAAYPFLQKGGEMGQLMREFDWSATSLGCPSTWPLSLQTILSVILQSRFPMFVWWGPELLCFYNDAYRPSLGISGKHPSILGIPAEKAWPEIWPFIQPLIQQVLDDGDATWSEDQLLPIYRNGKIEDVYWTFSYSPIPNDEGKVDGVLVTCVETTAKMQARQQLEEALDLLTFSTDAASLGTWDLNPHTNRFKSNARLKEWFGLGPDEELDLTLAFNAIKPADRQRVKQAIEAAIDYTRQTPYDIEYTIVNAKTGDERIIRARGKSFFNEQNVAYRFSGTTEDITDIVRSRSLLEAAEERARLAAEAAQLGTFDFNLEDGTEFMSPRVYEIYDAPLHSSRSELKKRIHPDDMPIRNEAINNAATAGSMIYEVRILHSDNSIYWIRTEGKVFYDADGKPYRMLGTVMDITQEKEFAQKQEEYIAIASHELRNPLTSLKFSLELLSIEEDEEQKIKFIEKGKQQANRILALTNELLNVSKISSGKLDINKTIFNLGECIDECVGAFQVAQQTNSFSIAGESYKEIKADKFRVEQVLMNLLSNASKYSAPGSLIYINVEWMSNEVKVTVKDEGIGIAETDMPYVFKKFSRLDNSSTIAGYGLGLYISSQIISKHGGNIGVESEKGKGSSFWFTLPIAVVQ